MIGLGKTTAGKRASWQINAAPGFSIVGAHTVGNQGMVTYGVDSGMGWGGGFYWQGGGAQVSQGEGNYSSPAINSPYFITSARMKPPVSSLARGQGLFFAWVTLSEHKWVTSRERRSLSKIEAWLQSGGKSPNEQALKVRPRGDLGL